MNSGMSCHTHSNTVQAKTCFSKKPKDLPHITLECCISCNTKGAIGSDIGFECEGSNNRDSVFWSYSSVRRQIEPVTNECRCYTIRSLNLLQIFCRVVKHNLTHKSRIRAHATAIITHVATQNSGMEICQ
jgi:hypothetical protein